MNASLIPALSFWMFFSLCGTGVAESMVKFPAVPLADAALPTDFTLVLSGGGTRGLAQIGVLRAFEENGMHPTLIVGASMGAIIGALYAAGYCADSIEHIARNIQWEKIFENSAGRKNVFMGQKTEPTDYLIEVRFDDNFSVVWPNAVSHGQAVYAYLTPLLADKEYRAGGDFNNFPIPLRVATTDITTGRQVLLSRDGVVQALRASCGVPLAFTPVKCNGMLLMDGGLAANIPVEAAVEESRHCIVAVDVTSPLWPEDELDNPIRLVDQLIGIGMTREKIRQKKLAHCIIVPDLEGIPNTDVTRLDTIIRRGYIAALEALPRIEQHCRSYTTKHTTSHDSAEPYAILPIFWGGVDSGFCRGLDSVLSTYREREKADIDSIPVSLLSTTVENYGKMHDLDFISIRKVSRGLDGTHVRVDPGIVSDIVIEGDVRTRKWFIRLAAGCSPGDTLTRDCIPNLLESLYALGFFNTVHVFVDSENRIHIDFDEKNPVRIQAALRFDEFHRGEGYVQPAYENLFGLGMCLSLHLQYGLRREKYALDLSANQVLSDKIANSARINGYFSREKIVSRDPRDTSDLDGVRMFREESLRRTGLLSLAGMEVSRFLLLEAGVRIENFKLLESNIIPLDTVTGNGINRIRYGMIRGTMDNLDRFPFPKKGVRYSLTAGAGGSLLGGTERFVKIDGRFRRYFSLFDRHTFSTAFKFTWANSPLPEIERVFLGGIIPEEKYRDIGIYNYVSFPGLPARSLPGDIMVLAEAHYRFSIRRNIHWISYCDWGYAWEQYGFSLLDNPLETFVDIAPIGVGTGIAWNTVFGPLRFLWGRLLRSSPVLYNDNDISISNVFYFSVGHDF